MKNLKLILVLFITILFTSCDNEKENKPNQISVPTTYEFERNGESTVDFSGQTTRLNMLSEIKSYLQTGDAGELISADQLNDMYANENNAFSNASLNEATKDLESKTFISDVNYFKGLFEDMQVASEDYVANGTEAQEGVSGRIERGNSGNFVLVNEKGWEFTQFIEKGLMGAVFYHQIYNVYLTDDRIGPQVDNETIEEGKNYTAKEHHFDEAFGYWGVPVDFPETLPSEYRRFWATYAYGREAMTNSATNLQNAFLKGRTAIVNQDQETLNEAREELYSEFEILTAATAVHYINDAISDFNNGDLGNLFHHVSEAYLFVRALKYNPQSSMSTDEINTILTSDFGPEGDFWKVTVEGLNASKNRLTTAFPELSTVADEL